MACSTRNGCFVRRKKSSPLVIGRVSRNSTKPKKSKTIAAPPNAQRQLISANENKGRRKAVRNPSAVGESDMRCQDNARAQAVKENVRYHVIPSEDARSRMNEHRSRGTLCSSPPIHARLLHDQIHHLARHINLLHD